MNKQTVYRGHWQLLKTFETLKLFYLYCFYFQGMLGYGLAKAAVMQLTKGLGMEGSGLPAQSVALAICP